MKKLTKRDQVETKVNGYDVYVIEDKEKNEIEILFSRTDTALIYERFYVRLSKEYAEKVSSRFTNLFVNTIDLNLQCVGGYETSDMVSYARGENTHRVIHRADKCRCDIRVTNSRHMNILTLEYVGEDDFMTNFSFIANYKNKLCKGFANILNRVCK